MSELMDPLAKDSRKAASAFWKGAHSFTFVSGMFTLGVGKQLYTGIRLYSEIKFELIKVG